MGKHAKLCPPSGWARWSTCSASVDLQTNEGSSFAAEGTAAHLLADTCFKAFISVEPADDPHDYLGSVIWVPDGQDEAEGARERFIVEGEDAPLTGWTFTVDNEMADNVKTYVDEVLVQDRDYLQSETAVPIDHITGEEGASGHADVLRTYDRTLAVHDLKYGKGVKVYAEDNGQQVHYLSGAVRELSWLDEFDRFEVHIHQPRLGHHDVWQLTRDELTAWEKKINKAAYPIVINGVRDFQPSTDGCKFCDHRRDCTARDNMAAATPADFPDDAPNGAYMAEILDRVAFLEGWIKDKYAKANDMVRDNPDCIPGWGMFPGRGSRVITDEEGIKKRLKRMRFKLDDYMPRRMLSAAQVEKLAGKQAYKEKLAEFVEHKDGQPKLGRAKGDRKTSTQQTLEDFGD